MRVYEVSSQYLPEAFLKTVLSPTDKVIYSYDIAVLEKDIIDFLSPKLLITGEVIAIYFDEKMYVYDLNSLEIYSMGEEPKFSTFGHLWESKHLYSENLPREFSNLLKDETIFRINIKEESKTPISITLRKRDRLLQGYQTWALYQTIINIKNKVQRDIILEEMIGGNFSTFNQQTILLFVGVSIGFVILNLIFSITVFPEIISIILNMLFGGVISAMLVWTYLAIDKNNKRFYNTYLRYKPS